MRSSLVRQKWASNEPVLVCCLHLTDPSLYEMVSLMGFHAIWMDMEHHGYSVETAGHYMRAARVASADILARPAKGEFMRMARMLEFGAQGILYPRCDDEHEAAEVVKWMKFAPMGKRGFDGGSADMPYCAMDTGEYVRQANRETFLMVQIEEAAALERAEAIAAVPGVDGIFFGPGDFSVLSGFPGDIENAKVVNATKRIAQAAKNAGKRWGMPAFSIDHARELLSMGASFLAQGCDIVAVKEAFELIQKQFAPLGFTFENRLEPGKSYLAGN